MAEAIAELDMRATCSHVIRMPTMIQLRNVPDDLHRRLKMRAAERGQSLSDFLIAEVRAIADKPTPSEMRARLLERAPARVRESAARAVRAERDNR
jgi:plasmid stability protein